LHKEFIKRKLDAVKYFLDRVLSELKSDIYAIYLFGSVAKGTADADSDIDILIIARNPNQRLYDVLSDVTFETYMKTGESIEFIVLNLEESLRLSDTSPFLYEVKRFGKLLYINGAPLKERSKALINLAEYYRKASEELVNLGYLRIALDTLYNAIELLIKASIIIAEKPLPRTHGGYLHLFGQLYVKTGKVRKDIIRDLHKCLESRNKARYEPEVHVSIEDYKLMQKVYTELRNLLSSLLNQNDK